MFEDAKGRGYGPAVAWGDAEFIRPKRGNLSGYGSYQLSLPSCRVKVRE
jgi:hypothetical protein